MLGWLRHELTYGATQRRTTRRWLNHLGGLPHSDSEQQEARPVAADADWQRAVLEDLAHALWRKVKDGHFEPLGEAPGEAWSAPTDGPVDFRFTSFAGLGADPWGEVEARGVVPESFPRLTDQVISGLCFGSTPSRIVAELDTVRHARSPFLLERLTDGYPRVSATASEERRDLFLLP